MFKLKHVFLNLATYLAIFLIISSCDDDNITDMQPDQSPAAPMMLGAQLNQQQYVEIYWIDMSDNETSFLVYRGESDSMNVIGVTQADQNMYIDESLLDSATYYYCVSAVNAFGESTSLDTVSITIPDAGFGPVEPYEPWPTDSTVSSSTDIVLRWRCYDQDYEGELAFDIYFDNNRPPQLVASNYNDSSSYYNYYYYDPRPLDGFTTYYWQIVARDEQGHEAIGPIWSFSTMLDISFAGDCDLPGNSPNISVSGNHAYLINSWIGAMIVDISDTENPVVAATISTPSPADDIQTANDYLYISCYINQGYSSLLIYDVADPTTPVSVGSYDSLYYPHGIAVNNNYAYIASHSTGLRIIDISNPADPVLAGFYEDLDGAYDVALDSNYAYVADVTSGLHVIDITNPANPVQIGVFAIPGGADRVAIAGNYAYLVDYYLSLVIVVDIENPANPRFVALYETINYAENIFPSAGYVFLACRSSGMLVLDITNPSDPILVGSYNTVGSCQDIYIVNNTAHLADGSNGLVILEFEP